MPRLIFIALLGGVLYWLFKRYITPEQRALKTKNSKNSVEGGELLRCDGCNDLTPARDVVRVDDRIYCGARCAKKYALR
ncbi:hypothetical protein ACQZV8_10590 [Magnetococcales bacterium HHB-1]